MAENTAGSTNKRAADSAAAASSKKPRRAVIDLTEGQTADSAAASSAAPAIPKRGVRFSAVEDVAPPPPSFDSSSSASLAAASLDVAAADEVDEMSSQIVVAGSQEDSDSAMAPTAWIEPPIIKHTAKPPLRPPPLRPPPPIFDDYVEVEIDIGAAFNRADNSPAAPWLGDRSEDHLLYDTSPDSQEEAAPDSQSSYVTLSIFTDSQAADPPVVRNPPAAADPLADPILAEYYPCVSLIPSGMPDAGDDEDDDESVDEPDEETCGRVPRWRCDDDRDEAIARRVAARAAQPAAAPSSSTAMSVNGQSWYKCEPAAEIVTRRSPHRWNLVGVSIASRDCPELPFFVSFARDRNDRTDQPVPYRIMMHALNTTVPGAERRHLLLSVRVLQRVGPDGDLVGEERYLCRDIAECGLPADVVCGYAASFEEWCMLHDPPGLLLVEFEANMQCGVPTVGRDTLAVLQQQSGHPSYTADARTFLAALLTGRALVAECTFQLTRKEAVLADTDWSRCSGYVFHERDLFTRMLALAKPLPFREPVSPHAKYADGWGTQFATEPPLTDADLKRRVRFSCTGTDITNLESFSLPGSLLPARRHPREQRSVPPSPPAAPIPTYPPPHGEDFDAHSPIPSQEERVGDEPPPALLVGVELNPGPVRTSILLAAARVAVAALVELHGERELVLGETVTYLKVASFAALQTQVRELAGLLICSGTTVRRALAQQPGGPVLVRVAC